VRQIDLDVARTWRWHVKFRERYGKWQKYIFRILLAYSAFDVTVGYCQGMSQIAALLLIVFENDEKAFWALCSLMNHAPWTQKGKFQNYEIFYKNYDKKSKKKPLKSRFDHFHFGQKFQIFCPRSF